jgi:hypothetical protein
MAGLFMLHSPLCGEMKAGYCHPTRAQVIIFPEKKKSED